MRLFGVTASQFFKIGLIALLFLLLFKFAASKLNIGGLNAVAAAV